LAAEIDNLPQPGTPAGSSSSGDRGGQIVPTTRSLASATTPPGWIRRSDGVLVASPARMLSPDSSIITSPNRMLPGSTSTDSDPIDQAIGAVTSQFYGGGMAGEQPELLLPYKIYKSSSRIASQLKPMSCGIACVRQFLTDSGVKLSESAIIKEINKFENLENFDPKTGAALKQLELALNALHPDTQFNSGMVDPAQLNSLNRNGSWIAMLRSHRGGLHYVIVDGITDGNVLIRDPWGAKAPGRGNGIEAELPISTFLDYWTPTYNAGVFPKRRS
jgi:Peptidase C39 family